MFPFLLFCWEVESGNCIFDSIGTMLLGIVLKSEFISDSVDGSLQVVFVFGIINGITSFKAEDIFPIDAVTAISYYGI